MGPMNGSQPQVVSLPDFWTIQQYEWNRGPSIGRLEDFHLLTVGVLELHETARWWWQRDSHVEEQRGIGTELCTSTASWRFFWKKIIWNIWNFWENPQNIMPILPLLTTSIYIYPYFWYVSSGYVKNQEFHNFSCWGQRYLGLLFSWCSFASWKFKQKLMGVMWGLADGVILNRFSVEVM